MLLQMVDVVVVKMDIVLMINICVNLLIKIVNSSTNNVHSVLNVSKGIDKIHKEDVNMATNTVHTSMMKVSVSTVIDSTS